MRPHGGAWIETLAGPVSVCEVLKSHPTRVRGLKHGSRYVEYLRYLGSHPTRVRGLKLMLVICLIESCSVSHPTRVRGLKQARRLMSKYGNPVAPHAGAWIETRLADHSFPICEVAPHAGAWIETHR